VHNISSCVGAMLMLAILAKSLSCLQQARAQQKLGEKGYACHWMHCSWLVSGETTLAKPHAQ